MSSIDCYVNVTTVHIDVLCIDCYVIPVSINVKLLTVSSGPIHRYIGNIDAFKIWYTYRYEHPKLVEYWYSTVKKRHTWSCTLQWRYQQAWSDDKRSLIGRDSWYILILTNSALPFIHTFLPICLLDKMERDQERKFLEFRALLTVKLFVWNTLHTWFMRKTK